MNEFEIIFGMILGAMIGFILFFAYQWASNRVTAYYRRDKSVPWGLLTIIVVLSFMVCIAIRTTF